MFVGKMGLLSVHANHVHLHAMQMHAHISNVHNTCMHMRAHAEWHMCEGPGKVVWRGCARAKGAKGGVDVEEPCAGEGVAVVVHDGAGQEAP